MDRTNKAKLVIDQNEKRRYSTTLLPQLPIDSADVFVVTTSFERLDLLASKMYGDATLWWIIASANNLGKGTFTIPPNIRLRIPMNIGNIQNQIESYNNDR